MSKIQIDQNMDLLRLSTAGSVDDGKSTLIGRLLYDCQAIYCDQLSAIERVSRKKGLEEVDLALLLDGLSAEREQGITIDVAYRYFSTNKRKFIIADVPGHEQYTRNMVTGASNVDLSLILIDARKGLLTQTKRHLFIASLLRIPHLLVIVNKMDLVDYDEKIFNRICEELMSFSAKLEINDLQFMPISALKGDMIVNRGEKFNWYGGSTLFSYLNNLQIVGDRNLIDFRFPIQYVMRPNQDFRGYAGKIEGGSIKKGEEVLILPSGKHSKIKTIIFDEKIQDYAFNPQSVVLTLEDDLDISRGDMIVRKKNVPELANELEAIVCWFSEKAMQLNKRYLIKHTSNFTSVFIENIKYIIDVNTLEREFTNELRLNEIGRLSIKTSKSLIFDAYSKNRNTGSFIIIDEFTNNTVGAGIIISKGKNLEVENYSQNLKKSENGIVLWFTGLSGSGKSTISDKLFEYLQKKGVCSERLDGDVMRQSLSKDLGFTKKDREKNIERAGFVANLLSRNGVIVLASFISPYVKQRQKLKEQVNNFVEIFIDTDLETCEMRDVKGLYKKARNGKLSNFTGISSPYENPVNSDIIIKTEEEGVDQAVIKIVNYLIEKGFLIKN